MVRGKHSRASKHEYEQKIIEEVKSRPHLYDKLHPDHKNALIARNSWDKIYEDLGENAFTSSGSDCKDLWSSLWSQYLGFKRKVAGSTGKAGGKRPAFRHELSMREFDDKEFEESTTSNISEVLSQDTEESCPGEIEIVFNNVEDLEADEARATALIPGPSTVVAETRPGDKAKKRFMNDFEVEMMRFLKSSDSDRDEFELFGITVAAKLRKINRKDEASASHLQFGIFELIYNVEKDLIK